MYYKHNKVKRASAYKAFNYKKKHVNIYVIELIPSV